MKEVLLHLSCFADVEIDYDRSCKVLDLSNLQGSNVHMIIELRDSFIEYILKRDDA